MASMSLCQGARQGQHLVPVSQSSPGYIPYGFHTVIEAERCEVVGAVPAPPKRV